MTQRTFQFRLRSSHGAPERQIQSLVVELLTESGEWEPQVPSNNTPGFRLYLLSLLLCQHHYLVANAQERNLPLQQVEGTFTVKTSVDWILEEVSGDFHLHLDPSASPEERSRADADAISDISERMKLCPVSRNLPASVQKTIELKLAS
jgi:uncharacterized OsmC-like protein